MILPIKLTENVGLLAVFPSCRKTNVFRHDNKQENAQLYLFGAMGRKPHMREAIRNEEFVVHYQPLIDFQSGKVSGVEALVRWEHPARGLISPDSGAYPAAFGDVRGDRNAGAICVSASVGLRHGARLSSAQAASRRAD